MPEHCTCGTLLVENARFCHRCGRPVGPQAALDELADSAASASAPIVAPPTTDPGGLPVGFRNPVAMRVAFWMSVGIMLIEMIPGVNLFFPLWWLAAGFGGVMLYRKITGSALSVKAGARLGSITGILTFLGMTIMIAFSMLVAGKELFQEMVKQNPQISPVLDDPTELAGVVLTVMIVIFALVVGTCAAGGALGARFGTSGAAPQAQA